MGNAGNTGGNTAVVLYGLSTGSRDWSQAHRDFAHLFVNSSEAVAYQEIRNAALANIRAQPRVFVDSLIAAGTNFGHNLFMIGRIAELNSVVTVLFLLGVCVCLLYVRHSPFALLLAVAISELLSAPFVFDSAGHRMSSR
jgi:hypothetical protein